MQTPRLQLKLQRSGINSHWQRIQHSNVSFKAPLTWPVAFSVRCGFSVEMSADKDWSVWGWGQGVGVWHFFTLYTSVVIVTTLESLQWVIMAFSSHCEYSKAAAGRLPCVSVRLRVYMWQFDVRDLDHNTTNQSEKYSRLPSFIVSDFIIFLGW